MSRKTARRTVLLMLVSIMAALVGVYLLPVRTLLAASSWLMLANLPTARSGLAATAGLDGRIYAIAGSSGGGTTVETYDPQTDSWATVTPLPTGRLYPGAATGADGRIYVVGGVVPGAAATTYLNTAEVYDPQTNAWAALPPMPTARYALAVVAGKDGRIYALGGNNNGILDVSIARVIEPAVATIIEPA